MMPPARRARIVRQENPGETGERHDVELEHLDHAIRRLIREGAGEAKPRVVDQGADLEAERARLLGEEVGGRPDAPDPP